MLLAALVHKCPCKAILKLLHGTIVPRLPCSSSMEVSCKSGLSKLLFKLLLGTAGQQLTCKAIPQGMMLISISRMLRCALKYWQRSWVQPEQCWAQSDQSVRDAACSSRAQVALRSYFLSFCMELSCQSFCMELLLKTCSAKLFFELLHGNVVQKLPFEAIFKLLFGTVEQKLTCKAISQGEMSTSIFRMLRRAPK